MRRLFIMRKDLNMSTGKLMAQVMHCAEAYWTSKIRRVYKNHIDEEVLNKTLECYKIREQKISEEYK